MSSSWDVTTTCSVVAVPGVAEVDGVGLGPVGAGLCAIAMLAPRRSIVDAIKNCFIKIFEKWIFQIVVVVEAFVPNACLGCLRRLAQAPLQLNTTQAK
jgi:hypothetical protein